MANKLNNVRFQLDFGMIPKIFYRDPVDFVLRTRRVGTDYIRALYNRYYETLNPMYFPDNPKQFTAGDFSLREDTFGKVRFITIALPREHEGSVEFCTELILAYRPGVFGIRQPRLFAVERSPLGIRNVGAMEPDGSHTTLGQAGTPEENFNLIRSHAFSK